MPICIIILFVLGLPRTLISLSTIDAPLEDETLLLPPGIAPSDPKEVFVVLAIAIRSFSGLISVPITELPDCGGILTVQSYVLTSGLELWKLQPYHSSKNATLLHCMAATCYVTRSDRRQTRCTLPSDTLTIFLMFVVDFLTL